MDWAAFVRTHLLVEVRSQTLSATVLGYIKKFNSKYLAVGFDSIIVSLISTGILFFGED